MTPHNQAELGQIAPIVIMPGDPLRAKFIAETYLENAELVNEVRGMFAYTGSYKGKRITVMASGMGAPSIGIYSYELYNDYKVEAIIRVGSCGAYDGDIPLYQLILVDQAYSESTYAKVLNQEESSFMPSDLTLKEQILKKAQELGQNVLVGNIHSTDVFYGQKTNLKGLTEEFHCLGAEMESFALFANAKMLGKKAACLLTVSDNLITGEGTSSEERQKSFTSMMELALETSLDL